MLDESEGEVAENERHLAFNNQTLWKRAAIVLRVLYLISFLLLLPYGWY